MIRNKLIKSSGLPVALLSATLAFGVSPIYNKVYAATMIVQQTNTVKGKVMLPGKRHSSKTMVLTCISSMTSWALHSITIWSIEVTSWPQKWWLYFCRFEWWWHHRLTGCDFGTWLYRRPWIHHRFEPWLLLEATLCQYPVDGCLECEPCARW